MPEVSCCTGIYCRYDAAGRLAGEDWLDGSGQGLYAFDYRFGATADRTQLTKNGETTYYQYNTLNQLTLERSVAGAFGTVRCWMPLPTAPR